jgi:hypothetical protein
LIAGQYSTAKLLWLKSKPVRDQDVAVFQL